LFELATKASDQTMVVKLQCFKHDKYGLKIKVLAYIKNEGANLVAMTTLLKIVVRFKSLGLEEPLQGTCFGHANMVQQI
jgi:hypothetical protein